jgi:ApbE superfamily uncharacterized protein (UPF0280 family)
MNSELKRRFFLQKIEDFKSDNCQPYPTVICEMERSNIIEIIRKNVLFSTIMKPCTSSNFNPEVKEVLGKASNDFGDLYILVYPN